MTEFEKTARNKVVRVAERGAYDSQTIYAILDASPICHLAFVQEGKPFLIPTIHARSGDEILLHGAKAGRLMKHIGAGNDVCIAVTHLDGLVLARSAFHHSMNYRSAVIFGTGRIIDDEAEKMRGFETITNRVLPGRWDEVRQPNAKEMNATALAAISIESASAKVRTGGPMDDEEDYDLPIWAGVVPIRSQMLEPETDPSSKKDLPVPEHVKDFISSNR